MQFDDHDQRVFGQRSEAVEHHRFQWGRRIDTRHVHPALIPAVRLLDAVDPHTSVAPRYECRIPSARRRRWDTLAPETVLLWRSSMAASPGASATPSRATSRPSPPVPADDVLALYAEGATVEVSRGHPRPDDARVDPRVLRVIEPFDHEAELVTLRIAANTAVFRTSVWSPRWATRPSRSPRSTSWSSTTTAIS